MKQIEYGFLDEDGNNIINNSKKWDDEFSEFYYLLSPDELLEKKVGVCWDQVELERKLFTDNKIKIETYFIYAKNNNNLPSHTFLVYNNNSKYYWFEHSWYNYKGIHEYESLNNLFIDVRNKFMLSNNVINIKQVYIYKYEKPPYHIKCDDFYKYCEKQENINLEE